jgi:predicted chitinase
MTDTPKLEKWAFPFKTAGAASTEVTDPQLYYNALAKAQGGFYPMGKNGLWHGGVHFDAGTAGLLDQSSVRCIADGEVIAYRIDGRYPTSQYGEGPEAVHLPFSRGFVLVKHRLELPPLATAAPTAATPTSATPASATPASATPASTTVATVAEALTFYSLYMHLLDWVGYTAAGAPAPPAFLAPANYSVSTRTTDPLLGLRVRKLPSGGSTEVLALLPKGCKVTLGPVDSSHPHWQQLVSVDQGAAVPALPVGTSGWVYVSQLTSNLVADLAKDEEPALTLSHRGLNVRKEGKLTGAIIGVLPQGATLKVGAKEPGGYCKVLEVIDYHGVPALPSGPDGKPLGYVYHAALDATQAEPASKDSVYLLPAPYSIKAGELIGHIGQYQNHDDAAPKAMLHFEVFSCDEVPAFISKSRALAASLPAAQKTLLKIHPNTKLVTHVSTMSATNPPKISDPGTAIGIELILNQGVLDALPAERKITVSEPVPGGAPRITRWWQLDNLADALGQPISGWLAEQDLITTRHSPWEWEGFDYISETTSTTEQLAHHLDGQCLLSEAQQPDYQAQISSADNGPIKTRLYYIIDGADGTARDDKLTVDEIKAALKKPWHAQSISRLITHYESEWFWNPAKWDELDKLLEHTPTDPNPDWVSEKLRIEKLSWRKEMAGQHGIKTDGMAWHFHVTGLLGNFLTANSTIITHAQLTLIFPTADNNDIDIVLSEINSRLTEFKLDSRLRQRHFFAQIKGEVGPSMKGVSESWEYSPATLKTFSSYYRAHPTEAEEDGYLKDAHGRITRRAYQRNIGTKHFQNLNGNRAEHPSDGYDFRGRGLIQITGHEKYHGYMRDYNKYWSDSIPDTERNPDLINSMPNAIRSAVWFWLYRSPYSNDNGRGLEDVAGVTYKVNGGYTGLEERKTAYTEIERILK